MFDRLERSWDLANACMGLLREDKSLLIFPLLSSIAMFLIVGSFAVPLYPLVTAMSEHGYVRTLGSLTYVGLFIFYWIQFTIVIFFNTALVEVAMERLDGREATTGDGLRRGWARFPIILAYSAIAATIGTVLRLLAERVGFIGKIVVGMIGFVWVVATALVVPVLAAEDVGPIEAVRRSVELIRKSWGEDLIGNTGIGLAFAVVMAVVAFCGAMLFLAALSVHSTAFAGLVLVILVVTLCTTALAQATLSGLYSAALYRYAAGETKTGDIDPALLESAFRARD
jgi:Family of unknown function (DUF6159)